MKTGFKLKKNQFSNSNNPNHQLKNILKSQSPLQKTKVQKYFELLICR